MKPGDRKLGHIMVANDTYEVFETKIEDPAEHAALPFPVPARTIDTVAEWVARLGDQVVAYAHLEHYIDSIERMGDGAVMVWLYVHPDHRRLGLGKFMCRWMTDLAIRYRQRTIVTPVDPDSEWLVGLLEEEEFELAPENNCVMRKELKWQ